MTNADYIRNMTDDELSKFFEQFVEGPWTDEFGKECCKKCPTVECTVEDHPFVKPMQLNECDFVDGVCPHGDSIKWWLNREYDRFDYLEDA